MLFKDLKIGDKFHTGKFKAMYPHSLKDEFMYCVFEKQTKSKAVCVDQIGYGNTRHIGAKHSFASFKEVTIIK